jgi:orotate phosphoribosyltransferase-like protein
MMKKPDLVAEELYNKIILLKKEGLTFKEIADKLNDTNSKRESAASRNR